MNTEVGLHFFNGALQQMEALLENVPDERWAEQPAGIRNHPAWTLGHVCCGHHFVLTLLGESSGVPKLWLETMNMGSTPVSDRSAYPAQDELWERYKAGHVSIERAVRAADAASFARENPVEAARSYFPTIGHGVAYFLQTHEPIHLGQLAVWKRAAGLADG